MKKAFTLIELLIVVAIIAILAAIAVPNFLEAQVRAKVSRVLSDQRTYATALETYMIDNNTYPLHRSITAAAFPGYAAPANNPTRNINEATLASAGKAVGDWNNIPSFAVPANATSVIGLTSPVSYLNSYVADAFASDKSVTYAYAASGQQYLIWSPGPNGTDELNQSDSAEHIVSGPSSLPSPYLQTGPNSAAGKPTTGGGTSGRGFTYEATNGTASDGDVYRNK